MSTLGKIKSALQRTTAENEPSINTAPPKIEIIDAEPLHADVVNEVIDKARANADALKSQHEDSQTYKSFDSEFSSQSTHTFDSPSQASGFKTSPPPFDPPRGLGPARKTDNLSHIRSDLAQLNEDMSSGEQFYAQSLKRINNLIDYAYETEANLSALEHLEPENRRLTAELEEARKKANDETVRAETLKSKADAYESRYLDTRQSLEQAQLTLSKLDDERDTLNRQISDKEVEIAGLTNSNRTIRNNLAVDRQSQEKLSAKNLSLSSELSVALSEKLELEKRSVEYTSRIEQLTADQQELERVLASTRSAHKATEDHNIALKTEMEQVLSDIQIFKQQFDSTSRTRDSEIHSLRAKASDLEAELSIKTDVLSHAHEEMTDLRAKHDAAHRGRRNLLEHIEKQKRDGDLLREAHESAKAEVKSYSSQIISLRAEVDELRRLNSAQSEKLKRYLAINSMPVAADTVARTQSPPARPKPQATTKTKAVEKTRIIAPPAPLQMQPPSTNRVSTPPIPDAAPEIEPKSTPAARQKTSVDFQPLVQPNDGRQIPKAQLESARYGMVGGIKNDHGMTAAAQEDSLKDQQASLAADSDVSDEFDREFASLSTPSDAKSPTPHSQAQDIDDTLNRFHEIDLLDSESASEIDRQVS